MAMFAMPSPTAPLRPTAPLTSAWPGAALVAFTIEYMTTHTFHTVVIGCRFVILWHGTSIDATLRTWPGSTHPRSARRSRHADRGPGGHPQPLRAGNADRGCH